MEYFPFASGKVLCLGRLILISFSVCRAKKDGGCEIESVVLCVQVLEWCSRDTVGGEGACAFFCIQ